MSQYPDEQSCKNKWKEIRIKQGVVCPKCGCKKYWWKSDKEYIEKFKFSTWLYRIAYNCFIDHKRKKSISTESLEAGIHVESTDRPGRMEFEGLYSAIDELPLDEKTAILLFYMEDIKIIDIAIVMRKPIGTVKSYLGRGRKQIKEKLRDE